MSLSAAMEPEIQAVLDEIAAWGEVHDAQETVHAKKMLNLEPDTARLVSILAQSSASARMLEIGTSNGYSTIYLTWVARRLGGHVTSIEHSLSKQAMAAENLRRTGLSDWAALVAGEALQALAGMQGPFDLVFLDADRPSYPQYLSLILPRLAPQALLLADNVHSHPTEIAGYLEAIAALPDFEHVVVGVGKGLSIAYRHG